MMFKKTLVKCVLTVLLLSTFAIGAFAGAPTSFSDVSYYMDNYQAIDYLRANDIVIGYSDGTYKPDQNINRAEFLKIVMEMIEIEPAGSECFDDVSDQWFAGYVCKAKDEGIIGGYPDGTFRPGDQIAFVEAAKILTNVFELPVSDSDGGAWFYDYVMALEVKSVIPYNINSFEDKITRGDMAEMVWRIDNDVTYKVSNTYENIVVGRMAKEKGGELKTFDSCSELEKYIDINKDSYFAEGGAIIDDFDAVEESPSGSAKSTSESLSEETNDYSSTNVQVSGVDEADVLKNDGKYIYYLLDNELKILSAYPPESMKELDSYAFDDDYFYPEEMYVDGNRVIVIGISNNYKIDRGNYSGGETKMYILDIKDRTDIGEDRILTFGGYYSDSRKVDDTVYLVMNQYNYYWDEIDDDDVLPYYMDGDDEPEAMVGCTDVNYVPGSTGTTDYLLVSAIEIDDDDSDVETEAIMGSYGTVYSSEDNLYIAEPKYDYWYWYDESENSEETYIHKFGLNGTNLDYKGVGIVPGTVDDQFSMDEDGNFFRIATTNGGWWSSMDDVYNNVYVLDKNLNIVGSVTGFASGEQIYSARFVGDRLYLVTFEQIDPLFVIDFGTPNNPRLLGQLKIPGVSEYLHPLDETHVIGFGKETLPESELLNAGWSWFQGLKLSLFDVTDVNAPREIDKVVIGDRGSSSELLSNHKALLYNAKDGYMAFPALIAEIPETFKADSNASWTYGDYVYQGAYVYGVDATGFDYRGRVSHYSDDELGDNFENSYWYGDNKNISRIIYIGDYLYSVSDYMVKASTETDVEEVDSVFWK